MESRIRIYHLVRIVHSSVIKGKAFLSGQILLIVKTLELLDFCFGLVYLLLKVVMDHLKI